MNIHPAFYLNFNAESCTVYHNDDVANDCANPVSGNGCDGETVWHLSNHQATVTERRTRYAGLSACRMTTTVCNDGTEPLLVDSLSSAFITDIGGTGAGYDAHRFIIHYAHMAWQGEAQWEHAYVEDKGLYPTYNHGSQTTIRFNSQGSWTTAQYYPLVILEDTARGECHYFEIHSSHSWYIEVSLRGYRENASLCVMLTAAHEKNDGWFVTLGAGESYTTVPAVYGCVKGGFEAAVAELTAYKRLTAMTNFPDGVVPVCFNDYMNCLWAQPSRDRLVPLIKAAAEVGCEVFCIDAGWFGKRVEWYMHNGDWVPLDELFGEGGLQGILDEIAACGMKPGVWFELETVDSRSDFATAHPEALLTRHGHPIGRYQCFMDFRQPVVRDHLMNRIDALYKMGVRHIKNDYNHCTGPTADAPDGQSGAEALVVNSRAFMAFIDEAIATHPGLTIENCGSGAMRCDHGSLSHFHIQSTSDQEYYDRYPSIIQGMLACMPPERAGLWAYPYPVDFHLRETQLEVYPVTDPTVQAVIDGCADGWQTSFNMVNGLMGCLYLSGRICYADGRNKALIREAIELYKANRTTLMGAVPVYPQGLSHMRDSGHTSLGLLNRAEGKLLLAVWQMRTEATETVIDLTPHIPDSAAVKVAYPHLAGFDYSLRDGRLAVTFPSGNCAAYFEITL